MIISDEQLDTFIRSYKEEFGVGLDKNTGYQFALKLVQLV